MNLIQKLKNRKYINFFSRYYFRYTPKIILNSKRFHQFLYLILIGKWFRLDFFESHLQYQNKDWVKLYDLLFINRIRDEDLTAKQKAYVAKNIIGPTVLDIGCGTGTMIEKIAQNPKVLRITGNDISPRAIRFVEKKFKNISRVNFLEGDILNLKLSKKFDTVICLHVLEHIKDIQKMVKLIKKITKKRAIIIVPNEYRQPFPPNYHLHFFNSENPVSRLFPKTKKGLKIIDGDYVLTIDFE